MNGSNKIDVDANVGGSGNLGSATAAVESRLARVVSAMRTHDVRLAFADQLQATLAHGGEMRPARDEGHVVAGERELRAHEPADRSRSEDADLHPPRPSFAARPMRCNLPVRPFGISRNQEPGALPAEDPPDVVGFAAGAAGKPCFVLPTSVEKYCAADICWSSPEIRVTVD